MGNFDPSKYATVDQRIAQFYADHPEGSIRTFVAAADETSIMFEARCYRSLVEARDGVYTSGYAHEVQGAGPINRTNHVENAETSAIGRALANLGYSGAIDGKKAPRPSREEMEKVELRRAERAEHEAIVTLVREWGARCAEEAEFKIAGKQHNAKAYIRENWPAIKEQYRVARAVVDAIEESTGERLT